MRFDFNDEQAEIKETARQLLASRFKPEKVRELAEADRYEDGLWSEVAELGWPGIAIAEEHGGQGLGMVELVVLCEELGYACAPLPFLANAAAGIAIERAGSAEQASAHLAGIASGEARGAIGDESVVIDAEGADVLVIFGSDGPRLVPAADAELEPLELIDRTRRYSRLIAGEGEPLAGDAAAATDRMVVAVAAELVGLGQRALDMAVAYAKEREQFGRPIGAYQGVSHTCAKMLYDVEEARSLTYAAAWAADAEPASLPLAAAMAKARASEAAWEICKASIQVHGGIGFTWEHDLHFLLKRARADAQLFGTAAQHKERVATLSGLG
ncbi:MAG TPA: acyl-CoA dehydrogenase family protein [Solirubrobacterales bacterium]|nr:acyl-CoA dehydrogenase family protein [Solirubrobacterales bacterium]